MLVNCHGQSHKRQLNLHQNCSRQRKGVTNEQVTATRGVVEADVEWSCSVRRSTCDVSQVELKVRIQTLSHCNLTLLVQRCASVQIQRLKHRLGGDTIDPKLHTLVRVLRGR